MKMRFLILAALCLFAAPAQASTFTFSLDAPYQSQSWTIELQPVDPTEFFSARLSIEGGPIITANTLYGDPALSSTTLDYGIRGDGSLYFIRTGCSENDFHCGRYDNMNTQDTGGFFANSPLTVSADEFVSGPYAFTGPLTMTITLPDDLNAFVVGVPEPATWAMLLLGFAGIGFVKYRRAITAVVSRQEHCRSRS